jgi:hypothetical protein
VKGLMRVIGMIVGMSLMLALFTQYDPQGDALTTVFGLPVVSVRQFNAHGWLALGQTGSGVLVIAQGGFGVVAFVQGGAALLFGLGQGMVSLVTIAQLGIGAFGFVGQVGVGAQATGQGVARRVSKEYFEQMSDEISELLSW